MRSDRDPELRSLRPTSKGDAWPAPIHPDATPVLLLDDGARDMWMNAPWELARDLQRPPSAGALKVVAFDTKQDSGI